MNIEEIGQANFSLPHDLVPLPSQGIFYKSKKKAIKVGYLTANDENFLVSGNQVNGGNIILTLLRNKIYEPDLRPEDLLEGDIEAILIFLRNTAFGPEYQISLTDPITNKQFSADLLIDELKIKQTKEKPDENGFFTTRLPKTGSVVKLKPLTYGEIVELDKMAEQYPNGRVVPKVTWRLNKMVQEIDGDSDRTNIALTIENLPIADSKHIRNFIKDNTPSLDLSKTLQAPSGEKVTFDVTFGTEFFRPFF
jgi:hypothetical protein